MTRGRSLRNERGIALAVAVFALVVIGALVAGTFFVGRLESRGGEGALASAQAFEAAEAGLSAAVAQWDSTADADSLGTVRPLATDQPLLGPSAPAVTYSTTATRLAERVWLVRSEGARRDAAGNVLARQLVGMLVKRAAPGDTVAVRPFTERGWAQLY